MANAMAAIDVSEWQGEIDWSVVAAHVDAVMIRGGTPYHPDLYFGANARGSQKAGLFRGVYLYADPSPSGWRNDTPKEHAELLATWYRSYVWELPPALDLESWGRLIPSDWKGMAAWAEEFLREFVGITGQRPILYCSWSWLQQLFQAAPGLFEGETSFRGVWLALWGDYSEPPVPAGLPREAIWGWQYSDFGRVPGIRGRVDLDWIYQIPDLPDHPRSAKLAQARRAQVSSTPPQRVILQAEPVRVFWREPSGLVPCGTGYQIDGQCYVPVKILEQHMPGLRVYEPANEAGGGCVLSLEGSH